MVHETRCSELCTAGAAVKCDRTVGLFMHFDTSCGARVDRYVDVRASRHSRNLRVSWSSTVSEAVGWTID